MFGMNKDAAISMISNMLIKLRDEKGVKSVVLELNENDEVDIINYDFVVSTKLIQAKEKITMLKTEIKSLSK